MTELPKVLIVSRLVWDDTSNSNTLGNLFKNYNPDKIARIYIESKSPNTNCCYRFFQISEFSLIKKLFNWQFPIGKVIDTRYERMNATEDNEVAKKEAGIFKFVRGHRLWIFSILRDILWSLNGWKSKELRQFIEDFDPDVIWLDGSPLILMNRLNNYVAGLQTDKPVVTFLMDDVYDYRSCASIWDKIYKFFLRKHVKKTVQSASHVFVASPKMKEEYDKIFGINSTFITKSIDKDIIATQPSRIHNPVKLVYLGNVLIGRLDTLCFISQAIKQLNQATIKIEFDIYTGDKIDSKHQTLLDVPGVKVHGLVPYNEVSSIIDNSDVQVFVESISGRKRNIARLSFSTKIIDYLASGKCVFAVGPADVAPIEYFKNEEAALVATSKEEITDRLNQLLNPDIIEEYARKAMDCGCRNHERNKLDNQLISILDSIAK